MQPKTSEFRYGNIVYYEDIPDCGYPICFNSKYWSLERLRSVSFDKPLHNNGARNVFIKPMEFNFPDFWENNTHLKCKQKDVPDGINYLHDFQNWYQDKFGEQPKIFRGKYMLNGPYFETLKQEPVTPTNR